MVSRHSYYQIPMTFAITIPAAEHEDRQGFVRGTLEWGYYFSVGPSYSSVGPRRLALIVRAITDLSVNICFIVQRQHAHAFVLKDNKMYSVVVDVPIWTEFAAKRQIVKRSPVPVRRIGDSRPFTLTCTNGSIGDRRPVYKSR